jgi:hypothetical protein
MASDRENEEAFDRKNMTQEQVNLIRIIIMVPNRIRMVESTLPSRPAARAMTLGSSRSTPARVIR